MLFWTHIYDLLAKLAVIGFAIFIGAITGDQSIGSIPLLGFWIALSLGVITWLLALRPLSSLLYAKFSLRTNLSFSESKRASPLYSPLLNMTKWNPTKEVLLVPRAERPAAIMRAVDELTAANAAEITEWKRKPNWRKAVEIFFTLLVLAAIIGFKEGWFTSTP